MFQINKNWSKMAFPFLSFGISLLPLFGQLFFSFITLLGRRLFPVDSRWNHPHTQRANSDLPSDFPKGHHDEPPSGCGAFLNFHAQAFIFRTPRFVSE
jgi:hypothetical protein